MVLYALTPKLLSTLGVIFLLIGFVTLLSAVGHMQTFGSIPWLFFGYVALDTLLGLGLCMRERWTVYLLGLNFAGFTVLHATTVLFGGSLDILSAGVNILFAGAMWGLVYRLRNHLADTAWGRIQGIAFLAVWMFVYVYLFVITLMK